MHSRNPNYYLTHPAPIRSIKSLDLYFESEARCSFPPPSYPWHFSALSRMFLLYRIPNPYLSSPSSTHANQYYESSAQEVCSNADGTTTTSVINNTCGCPGPTTTVFANTVTETSTADCHGCFDIVATTTREVFCLIVSFDLSFLNCLIFFF